MAWFTTKDGRHINTDWLDKDRQIAENKKQADKMNGKLNGISVDENGALPDKSPFHSYKEGTEWIARTTGLSMKEAGDAHEGIQAFSDYGYKDIHNYSDEKNYYNISGKQRSDAIDKYLNSPSIPKYKGNLYRGMTIRTDNLSGIDKMLESGIWKEPGITSFSTDEKQAHLYSNPDSLSSAIHITLKNNTHASTIGHLSIGGGEREALYPSSIKNGLKIVDYKKIPIYRDKLDRAHFRATGEKRYIKAVSAYEYEIILSDEN